MKWGMTEVLGKVQLSWGSALGSMILILVVTTSCAGPDPATMPYAKPEPTKMTPSQRKIDAKLLRLDHQVRKEGVSITAAAASMGVLTTGDRVLLDIVIDRQATDIAAKLSRPGVLLKHVSTTYGRVSAAINDPALLYELAALPEVRMIMPEYGARTHDGARSGAVGKGNIKKP